MRRQTMPLVVAMAAMLLLVSGVALADVIVGTNKSETLVGTDGPDLIKGLGGSDRLFAKDRNDHLRAGPGNDRACGERGHDTYSGGTGADLLSEYGGRTPIPPGDGYTGKDVMFGGGGSDWLEAARDDDELHGGSNSATDQICRYPTCFNEALFGDTGNDKLYGEDGPDHMEGEQGSDLMSGGDQADDIDAAADETAGTPDTVNCGPGVDTVRANDNDDVARDCEDVTRVANPRAGSSVTAADAETESKGNR
jgi:Ca2+-binding RTX toxin-like protein